MDVDALVEALTSHSYRYGNEIELQNGIEKVLRAKGFDYRREVELGKKDRIDFVVELPRDDVWLGTVGPTTFQVGMEVKIYESLSAMTRQLARYAKSPKLDVLVFASASRKLLATVPRELSGKKIVPVSVGGMW